MTLCPKTLRECERRARRSGLGQLGDEFALLVEREEEREETHVVTFRREYPERVVMATCCICEKVIGAGSLAVSRYMEEEKSIRFRHGRCG